MKKNKFGRVFNTLLIVAFLGYAVFTFIKQEIQLATFDLQVNSYSELIDEESLKTEQLNHTLSQITSSAYLEQVARDIGYVLPSETVFVDATL